MIGQANRVYIQGRGYFSSSSAYEKCSPIHELRMENGGIVFARNSTRPDPSMPFPQTLKSHQPYEIKPYSSRYVSRYLNQIKPSHKYKSLYIFLTWFVFLLQCRYHPWSSYRHEPKARLDSGLISDVGTLEKRSISSRIHAMQESYSSGPLRPSQFLEGRRWPPREFISNQSKEKEISKSNNIWSNSLSQNLRRWNSNSIDTMRMLNHQKSSFVASHDNHKPLINLDNPLKFQVINNF